MKNDGLFEAAVAIVITAALICLAAYAGYAVRGTVEGMKNTIIIPAKCR